MNKNYLLLICIVILISVIPLLLYTNVEFSGSDDKAEELIKNINPGYTPWVNSIWKPSNDNTERLIFGLQGTLGISFIGCYIYYYKGEKKKGNGSKDVNDR